MISPYLFAAGQEIVYVCFGADPTFTNVVRPVFHLHSSTVKSITKDDLGMRLKDVRGRREMKWFAHRTAFPCDSSRVEAIIKDMAQAQVQKYRHWAQPHVWRPGTMTLGELDKFVAVAKQYEDGDYVLNS